MKYTFKTFINKDGHHSDASICCSFKFWGDDGYRNDADIVIRDCHDKVNIDCAFEDEEEYENVLHKTKVLINTIISFRRKLREFHDTFLERKVKAEEEQEKLRKELRKE